MNPDLPNNDKTKALWKKARASGMSRREFLILLTSAGAAAVLTACTSKAIPAPTAPPVAPPPFPPTPAPAVPTPTPTPAPVPVPMPNPAPAEPFARQTNIEVVTNNASPNNPWGGHQTRIVHTQDGIFTAYIVEGSDILSRVWQLSKRQSDGTWTVIAQGDTGSNPVDLLASPDGTLHIIGWPNGIGKLWSGKPKDGILVMTSMLIPITIPDVYQGSNSLRYSSGIDASGNIAILLSFGGKGAGGEFKWGYYVPSQSRWVTPATGLDYMYTYTYLFPGPDGQVSLVATRDVPWAELGYTQPPGSSNQVFNAFRYWRTGNIYSEIIQVLSFAEEIPTDQYPYPILNAQTDAYLDTKYRMHILYTKKGATTGGKDQYRHRIVSSSGTILFDEELPKDSGSFKGYFRIFQDRLGRFYLMSQSGLLYLMDQEGENVGNPIKLDLGGHQVEYSGYYLSVPRTGTPLNDVMDVAYPSDNGRSWLYFRLDFSGK